MLHLTMLDDFGPTCWLRMLTFNRGEITLLYIIILS